MMENELAGQVALVTGGSRGIGLAIAHALAEGGARVVPVARNGDQAAEAASGLAGDGHFGLRCDVSDAEEVGSVVGEIKERAGPVTILVNNAGITRDNILLRLKDDDWASVLDVNLRGAFNTTRAVSRGMMKNRDGVIVNISSVVGLMGNPGQVNYAASKAGLHGMTRSVARELAGRGIRCNAVAPGFIETDMTAALTEEQTEALKGQIPLGRLGVAEEVATLVRFLAGPGGRYITGQVLAIDGGMTMR